MISLLRKKHQTTAQKSTAKTAARRFVRRSLLIFVLASTTSAAAFAADGQAKRLGSGSVGSGASTRQTAALSWRTSPLLEETAPTVSQAVPQQAPVPVPSGQIQRVAYQQPSSDNPQKDPFMDLFGNSAAPQATPSSPTLPPSSVPPNLSMPNQAAPIIPGSGPAMSVPGPASGPAIQENMLLPPATPRAVPIAPPSSPTIPNDLVPGAPLPPSLPPSNIAPPSQIAPEATEIEPPATSDSGSSPASPFDTREESPSDQPQDDSPMRNPFRQNLGDEPSTEAPPALDDQGIPMEDAPPPPPRSPLPSLRKKSGLSCDEVRASVKSRTIEKISLDISPPFRPDIIDNARLEKLRKDFLKSQKPREWRNIQGRELAEGSLQDLEFEQAVIRTPGGQIERIPLSQLSEPDLAYLSEAWGLPRQCRLAPEPYNGRCFTPSTLVWKASGLCHSPLYFEEVQLERYGHTAGPVLQPVISSAHFFANIAVLPYKMGIHPLGECQYALGYYRPGNCAPWMIPPVPLSLRGALAETAVVVGGIALIP